MAAVIQPTVPLTLRDGSTKYQLFLVCPRLLCEAEKERQTEKGRQSMNGGEGQESSRVTVGIIFTCPGVE